MTTRQMSPASAVSFRVFAVAWAIFGGVDLQRGNRIFGVLYIVLAFAGIALSSWPELVALGSRRRQPRDNEVSPSPEAR